MLILSTFASASEINIIVAGQSNAVGWTPGYSLQNPAVVAWNPQTQSYETASDPMPFFAGVANMCAPWIRLGWILKDEGGYSKIKFTGSGTGGVPISYWDEGEPGWVALKSNIEGASAQNAAAFIWYQGESNYDSPVGYYRVKLKNLIDRVRTLTRAKLPVIIVKPSNGVAGFYDALYAEQYAVADADLNVTIIDCVGFEPFAPTSAHISYQSQNLLAKRVATVLLAQPVIQAAPVPSACTCTCSSNAAASVSMEWPKGMVLTLKKESVPPPGFELQYQARAKKIGKVDVYLKN